MRPNSPPLIDVILRRAGIDEMESLWNRFGFEHFSYRISPHIADSLVADVFETPRH
jgi:hypothetical protein